MIVLKEIHGMPTPSGTLFQISRNSEFNDLVLNYSGAYENRHPVESGILPKDTPLYARIKHTLIETDIATHWSPTRQFSIVSPIGQFFNIYADTGSLNANFTSSMVLGEYIYVCGTYDYTPWSSGKPFIMKLDNNGNILWQKTTTHSTNNWNNSICGSSEDGIFTLGYGTISYLNCMFLTKWNFDGSLIWQKVYYAPSAQYADGSACKLVNGYLYLIGYVVMQGDNGVVRPYIYKVSPSNGANVWGKKIQYTNSLTPKDICIYNSISYYLCNDEVSNTTVLFMFDENGNIIGSKSLPISKGQKISAISNTLYICGTDGSDAVLLKCDLSGNSIQLHKFTISTNLDTLVSMIYVDNKFYLVGNSNISNTDYTVEASTNESTTSQIFLLTVDGSLSNIQSARILKQNRLLTCYDFVLNSLNQLVLFGKIYLTTNWKCFMLNVLQNSIPSIGSILGYPALSWENISGLGISTLNPATTNVNPSVVDYDVCTSINGITHVDSNFSKTRYQY